MHPSPSIPRRIPYANLIQRAFDIGAARNVTLNALANACVELYEYPGLATCLTLSSTIHTGLGMVQQLLHLCAVGGVAGTFAVRGVIQ